MDGSLLPPSLGVRSAPLVPPNAPALAALSFAALSSIPLATILIGGHGVAYLNPAAERLLRGDDGLLLAGPHGLTAASRLRRRELEALIEHVCNGGPGGVLPIPRLRATMPLMVSVEPLKDELFQSTASGFALVVIQDPQQGCVSGDHRYLTDTCGLTAAEAGVASALVAGCNAKRIASQRGVAVCTVRTQIRQILAKTNCRSQRELVARFAWLGCGG